MSGRKSTEVNGLLARGKDARNAGNANYLKHISTAEKNVKTNQEKITEISRRVREQRLIIGQDCKDQFPEEAKQLEEQFDSLRRANQPVDYGKDLEAFQKRRQKIETELQKADKEADRIRERIRNKNWYCDDEYEDADKLLKTYRQIGNEKSRLIRDLDQKVQISNKELIQYQNLEKRISQILLAHKQLEERAEKIVRLHKKASEAKDYIKKAFNLIDHQLVEKFLPGEYEELKQKCDDFFGLSDEEVTRNVTALSEQIGLFENRLQICYETFLEQKEKADAAVDASRQILNPEHNFFYEPVDYAKNKEKAGKIGLLEYLEDYSDKQELVGRIRSGIRQAEEHLKAEQFGEVQKQVQINNELIHQAVEYAAVLQEHLIENFYVARDIKGVMRKMGFETGAFKIDGSVKNGWKICAKNPGGDTIDFTKVFINDNGDVKIDIDHQTVGNCPSKWEDICKALDDVGIHIEKVDMENGSNVLNRREQKKRVGHQESGQFQTLPSH